MNETDYGGARPLNLLLRLSVIAGVESAVQIHIARGDDLNARDANGMTPLMLSAARDKSAICKLLLSAGADHGLLDPSGRTALEIAIAAGSSVTAAVLESVREPIPKSSPFEIKLDLGQEQASTPHQSCALRAEAAIPIESGAVAQATEPDETADPPPNQLYSAPVAVVGELGDGEFDLSGWEAEEEPTRPQANPVVLHSASALQIAITAHEPVDSSAEWDEIDAYLPEVALPLARAEDAEGRARLRLLLLRALREGSVPALDVQAQCTNEDRSTNPEAETYLAMVINDIGAEVDERIEYADADESFEVFVDSNETPTEAAALDEALAAIDRAASPRHEPLRIYQREFQRLRLLTAEEEIQLGKDMEAALYAALDALATWPAGIKLTLAAGADAVAGTRSLSSIWVGGEPDPEPVLAEGLVAGEPAQAASQEAEDEDGEPEDAAPMDAGGAAFAEALHRLARLVERGGHPSVPIREIREALAGLRLNRRFLLELIDAAKGPQPCDGFQRAMADFRKARDRMTAANLKLAFFHAKKYLYSGEPLDDLAQEGNIGLLKAVDRYDWRRGFRFSTYATWWIRQQIGRHVAEKCRTIRVPVHVHERLQRVERTARAFEAVAGRKPTIDELAERVEIPIQRLTVLLHIAPEPISIDESTLHGSISIDAREHYTAPHPEDVVDEIQLNRAVDRFVSSLSTKDRKEEQILRMRFGIGVFEAMTLEEIGARLEVSRERIRQIETRAMKKLRNPARSESFARMALGLEPDENPLAPAEHEIFSNGGTGAAKRGAPLAAVPYQASTPLSTMREEVKPDGSSTPTALERVLAQADQLGVRVSDDRQSPSGRIWVSLVNTPDNPHRRLARKLIEFGFEYVHGKGYWK